MFLIVKLKMWYILIAKLWHNLLNILHIFGESYVKFRAMRSQCWCLQDQTVTGKYYCNVSKRLRKSLRRKRPEICRSKDKFLHQDNAHAHTSLVVRQFPPPPILARSCTVRLFSISQNETPAQKMPFWSCGRKRETVDFQLFPIMLRSLKSLY